MAFFEWFVAKKLAFSNKNKNNISAPIIKIAIVAVALSLIMILISVATGTGLQTKIREKISTFSGNIIITHFDNNRSEITLEPIEKNQNFYPKFSEVAALTDVQPFATKAGVMRTSESFEGVIFKGVDKKYPFHIFKNYLMQGTTPQMDNDEMSNEVIISSYFAQRLKLKIGDTVSTYFIKNSENEMPFVRGFIIVGIYSSGMENFDQNYIIGDIRQIQRMNKWNENQIGGFELWVNDFDNINRIADDVYTHIPYTLNAVPISEKFYNIFEWLKLFDTNIYIILVLMILVAAINMIVALLVLIMERAPMIGTMKSFGTGNWRIRKIFLYQASYILMVGLAIGNVLAVTLLFIQKKWGIITLDPNQYYVNVAPVNIDWFPILIVNIAFIVICYSILIIPSYIITNISPIEAMKKN